MSSPTNGPAELLPASERARKDVVTWNELLAALAEPFPAELIQWRAGQVSRDRRRAQALPYAEARIYEDRLNEVCPGEWAVTFEPWGNRIICELTITLAGTGRSVTRSSTGESDGGRSPGTAAEAQAFKRACSRFGLGRFFYDLPAVWVDYDDERKKLLERPKLTSRT
jgi:hypothetical protein